MSERKTRLTVTVDAYLADYAEQLAEAGRAESVSAVVNAALRDRAQEDRRVGRRWDDALASATDEDRARAQRMLARIDEHEARRAETRGGR